MHDIFSRAAMKANNTAALSHTKILKPRERHTHSRAAGFVLFLSLHFPPASRFLFFRLFISHAYVFVRGGDSFYWFVAVGECVYVYIDARELILEAA